MKQRLLFFLILSTPFVGFAQNEDCACCSPGHQEFDFWVGDWEVFNEKEEKIGENFIEKLEDNCILSENWKGAKGGSGRSYNYYEPSDHTWNQLWISNTGNILKLKGNATGNKMILKSEPIKGEKGNYYNQITWTHNADGSVTQLWEIYDADDNLLNNVFKGTYRKKKSD